VSTSHIQFSVDDGVAWLTLNRPDKRNALSSEMLRAIVDGLADLAGREDVRALGVRGSGGSFCSGGDLASVKNADGTESTEYRALAEAALTAIREFPRPTAALVEGACIGAGILIALECDVRFATPGSKFAIPAVRYGLPISPRGLARLVEVVGSGQAHRFFLSAMTMLAPEAREVGMVEWCGDDAAAAAAEFLSEVAKGDPASVAATREMIRRAATPPLTP